MRLRASVLAVLLCASLSGCASLATTDLGTFQTDPRPSREGWVHGGVVSRAVWYVPNRIVDFAEVINFGFGLFLSTSMLPVGDQYATTSVTGPFFYLPSVRWGDKFNYGASAGAGVGLGWSGRGYSPLVYGWQYYTVSGDQWNVHGSGRGMPLKSKEFGFVAAPGFKLAFEWDEAWDFVAGLWGSDPLGDDFDRRPPGDDTPPPEQPSQPIRRRPVPNNNGASAQRRGPVTLEGIEGQVDVIWPDKQDWEPGREGQALVNGSHVYVGENSGCRIVVPALDSANLGKNYLEVTPLTELELRKGDLPGTWDVVLLGGEVKVQFEEHAMNDRVRVVTAEGGDEGAPGQGGNE